MRGVSLLVQLARHELEERRSDLGCIDRARANTEAAIGAHDDAVLSEASIALSNPSTLAEFGAWASQSARTRTTLQDRFVELDAGAAAARENLRDAVAQVRRLEIVLEDMREKTRRKAVRQADAAADERELAGVVRMMSSE